MMLRAIDLCAGAGGLSLGLCRAGFDVHGVELDEDACATHRANVGACERASIVGWHPVGLADLVAGGVPCQPFSEAGKREGTAREDGRLYLELIRIGVEAEARALLLENVEGMLSWRDGDGWSVVARIEDCMRREGYEPRRQVLCAADYGVPQKRYRLFILGLREPWALTAWRWPNPSHASPDTCRLLGLKSWVTMREALGLGPFATGDKRAREDGRAEKLSPLARYALAEALDRPAPTILANRHDETCDPKRPSRRPLAEVQRLLAAAGLLDRPSTTIAADPRVPVAGHHERQQNGSVRLSVEQLAILQGFPPGFAFRGATSGSRHRQVGNAVPPPLAEALGHSLARALAAAGDSTSLQEKPCNKPRPT